MSSSEMPVLAARVVGAACSVRRAAHRVTPRWRKRNGQAPSRFPLPHGQQSRPWHTRLAATSRATPVDLTVGEYLRLVCDWSWTCSASAPRYNASLDLTRLGNAATTGRRRKRPPMTKRILFTVVTPLGYRVSLSRDRWRQITRFKHPALAGHEKVWTR